MLCRSLYSNFGFPETTIHRWMFLWRSYLRLAETARQPAASRIPSGPYRSSRLAFQESDDKDRCSRRLSTTRERRQESVPLIRISGGNNLAEIGFRLPHEVPRPDTNRQNLSLRVIEKVVKTTRVEDDHRLV